MTEVQLKQGSVWSRKRISKGNVRMTLASQLGTSWDQIYFWESGVLGSIPGLPGASWVSSKGRNLKTKQKPLAGS
jgi:hypothetical protein